MFTEPAPTPYDLNWTMFGIHVRVHPFFWLMCLLMSSTGGELNLTHLAIWIGCVFVSILIHELGHVWMGQVFGSRGHIVLHSFGGLAIGSANLRRRWQRIAVSAAGPAAGFIFLGLLLALLWAVNPDAFPIYIRSTARMLGIPVDGFPRAQVLPNPVLAIAVFDLIFINLMWGTLNLLPVWPLDGGQITRELCEGVSEDRGFTTAMGISMMTAGVLALHCFVVASGREFLPIPIGGLYAGILFTVLAVQSFLAMQQAYQRRRWTEQHWDD